MQVNAKNCRSVAKNRYPDICYCAIHRFFSIRALRCEETPTILSNNKWQKETRFVYAAQLTRKKTLLYYLRNI